MPDITPKYDTIPMKLKVVADDTEVFGQTLGGLRANATSVQQGYGDNIFKVDHRGMWLGAADFSDAPFSVSMAGAITGVSIDVQSLSINNLFFVDSSGNHWSGASVIDNAPFAVTNLGALTSTSGTIGGWALSSTSLSNGSISLNSTAETILIGSATAPLTGTGVFLGKDGSDYEFRVGNPSGDYIHYDGTNWSENLTQLPTEENLALYWSLDENVGTTAYDESGNSNNGTITGASYSAGISGNSVLLAGATHKIQKSTPSFVNDAAGAVSVWIKAANNTHLGKLWSVSVSGSSDDEFYADYRGDDQDQLRILLAVNGAITMRLETAANTITDTDWHHIVVTSNGSTIKLYLDEVEKTLTEAVGSNTGQWFASATDADTFTAGGLQEATLVNSFEGNLDEIRVYSANLTARNVKALFKNPSGTKFSRNLLGFDRLVAGTITSQAITLALLAGGGDVKLQAGKTDFGDDITSGFILGLDDSDSDLPKFEIGSSATKIFKYDGTDLSFIGGTIKTATSGKRIEIASADNTMRFYDSSGNQIVGIGSDAVIPFRIDAFDDGNLSMYVVNDSSVVFASTLAQFQILGATSTGPPVGILNAGTGNALSINDTGTAGNSIEIVHSNVTDEAVEIVQGSGANNAIANVLKLYHRGGGPGKSGEGVAMIFSARDTGATEEEIGNIDCYYTTQTAGSEVNQLDIGLRGTTYFSLVSSGNVIAGNQSALATNATDGFLYIPTMAGAPSGTPTAYTGKVAMVYDTTNNDFYVYNGAWKKVTLA